MRLLKHLAIAALLIYVCVQVVVIFPRYLNKEEKEVAVQEQAPKKSEQILEGVHLVESQKGSRDWELLADKALTSGAQTGSWKLQKVTVHFYNKETKEFTVTGDEGDIDQPTKNISVKGNVVINSFNGYVFKTNDVYYKATTRSIETESPIEVQGPEDIQGKGFLMKGIGLRAEVDTSNMYILKDVKARKGMKDSKDVEVESNSALLSGRKKEVFFQGNTKVKYDFMSIEAPESNFKYSSNFLEEILFSGGVKALQTDRKATSQQLLVRVKEQKLIFKGNPVLMEKEDELRGDEIILVDGGRKVMVEKSKDTKPKVPNKK
ncbi:MAG: LPS export ABC transporter periplasmic protein LptC [Bdellovibrionota bacterium]